MTTKTVNIKVYVGTIEVGSGNVSYDDESYSSESEIIISKTLSFKLYIGNVEVGNANLPYDDYVAYESGGTRTIILSGDVLLS